MWTQSRFRKPLKNSPLLGGGGERMGGGGGGTKPGHNFLWSQLAWLDRSLSTQNHPRGHLLHSFQREKQGPVSCTSQSVFGGPSIGFSSQHEKGKTFLRQAEADKAPHRLCRTVGGYDANSLYWKSLSEPMPVGFYFGDERPASFV